MELGPTLRFLFGIATDGPARCHRCEAIFAICFTTCLQAMGGYPQFTDGVNFGESSKEA